MSRSYSFRVPASTSNLGAGFDALALALDRYLKVRVEIDPFPSSQRRGGAKRRGGQFGGNSRRADHPVCALGAASPPLRGGEWPKYEIVVRGVDAASIPTTSDNLILRVAQSVAAQRKRPLPPFRITIDNEIPLARGMGSSAAAIIAGITCYELGTKERLSEREIFHYAHEFEPHPDNLSAALRGGLITATESANGDVLIAKMQVADGVKPIVVIPAFELSTEKARAVLPQTYSRRDAVFNIQRSALTIAALTTGNLLLLREAMRDRIHQPYRAALIPGFEEILALNIPGLLGVALSGAGPTVFAFAKPANAKSAGRAIASVFEKHGVRATPMAVNIDSEGRSIAEGELDL
ncbi:MAG: homoserine kinase [Acidobacteria bacterium 13_1_40CM_3_56_11]|nr:MAG: homoserine kinase [Acidobacteria bacterium 13_1_40CM_3_56_11]